MDQRRAATVVGGSNDTSNMRSKEQQYTPDTATVREVYYAAPGNRDWEAARAASFDRWLAAHDAEVLASVQPPERNQEVQLLTLTPEQRRRRMCHCTPEPVMPNAEPPRHPEDMSVGTTFRIDEDEDDEVWTVQDGGVAVCSTHGVGRYLHVFKPSTVRDVTPPKGNRG